MEYSSLIYIFYIPLVAVCGYLLFNTKRYNLPEYLVIGMYTLSTYSIVTFPISLTILLFAPQLYLQLSLFISLALLLYCLYVAYRHTPYGALQTLWRSVIYTLLFSIGYFGLSIALLLVLILTGNLMLEDFAPKD